MLKEQTTMSRSSTEAKYRSLAFAIVEVAWIVQLRDLHINLSIAHPILCNNKSVVFMAHNPLTHPRSKHIAIDYHFVCKLVS